MATKKAAKRQVPAVPRKRKPATKTTNIEVIPVDGKQFLGYINNLTETLNRSNSLVESLSKRQQMDTEAPAPISSGALRTSQAGEAPTPSLPPLEILVHALANKVDAIYGFSCHLRGVVQDCNSLTAGFTPVESTLKGFLDMAYRQLEATHENMIATRNTIS